MVIDYYLAPASLRGANPRRVAGPARFTISLPVSFLPAFLRGPTFSPQLAFETNGST
jgi:hypothetical protein